MAEELAGERAHLEEAEVFPVARARAQSRLAPGDRHRFPAMGAEDAADRMSRRLRSQEACLSLPDGVPQRGNRPRRFDETMLRSHESLARDVPVFLRRQEPAVMREEADDASLFTSNHELVLEAGLQCCDVMLPLRGTSSIRRLRPVRFRRDLCHERERAQANE
jgi:hypothetical protein